MSKRQSNGKLTLGVIVATLAASVTALLSGFVYLLAEFARSVDASGAPTFYVASLYVGVVAMTATFIVCPILFVTIGLPLYALSLRLNWVSIWHYAATGFGVSCIAAAGA